MATAGVVFGARSDVAGMQVGAGGGVDGRATAIDLDSDGRSVAVVKAGRRAPRRAGVTDRGSGGHDIKVVGVGAATTCLE